ncbi:hypothetical protein FOMPIDRAFT_1055737 [Fomitopsis schrenkii]|uniref:CBM1 domain-containing protein n=1 Tax=Fomitopsis schrenkii TaxID=2126942 RepID=S8DJI7_FOMSC|nr:hypothetical protein FOMPIDRAFT_1055737 [Fomitopsis schrenkii]
MRSTIITAALALAYGITATAAMAAPAPASVDGPLHEQYCAKVGDWCSVNGTEGPTCCDRLFCFSESGSSSSYCIKLPKV